MCVEILLYSAILYSAILFTTKFTDHVIAAKCPYDEIPGNFKLGNLFSGERGDKEILIFRSTNSFLSIMKL